MTGSSPAPTAVGPDFAQTVINDHQPGESQWGDLAGVIQGLEHRLATQPVIEQAKGILMGHFGIGPETAFDVLRRWSSHSNVKVRDISLVLVTTATANQPGGPGRASQELIDLIASLGNGQVPSARGKADQSAAV